MRSHPVRLTGIFAAACLTLAPVVAGANAGHGPQMTNPSFENGLKGWWQYKHRGPGRFKVDHKIAAQGEASCRIEIHKERGRLELRQLISVKPGKVYRVSFMYRTAKKPMGPRATTIFRPESRASGGYDGSLCYLGQPHLPRTYGQWRRATYFLKGHPNGTRLGIAFQVVHGQTVWLDAFDVQPAEPGPDDRVYAMQPVIYEPVYKQVLGDQPRPYKVYPAWSRYQMSPEDQHRRGLKFGFEVGSLKAQYEELARNDFAARVKKSHQDIVNRTGVPVIGFNNNYGDIAKKASQMLDAKHRVPVIHPVVQKLMRDYARNMHERWGDSLWGLFYIGEVYSRATHYMRFWNNHKQQKAEINKQVRSEYGHGRFGLPESDGGKQPSRWIAYRRWMDDQLFDLFSSIQKISHERDPSVVLIGPNERSGSAPRDWERLAKTWDITTSQGHAAWRAVQKHDVGFITKLMRDLSFKPTMPFPQVVSYGYASTVPFTREQWSQVLRNGGAGFWINAKEWKDRELQAPKYSAPRRWRAMKVLAKTARETPKLDFPAADTAVLYSVDTYQARPASGRAAGEAAATHAFLGPEVGSWFHFISEYQIERGSRDLDDYRVIYLPAARHLRRNVAERLVEYVENGGKLVCLDPTAFDKTDYGKDLTDLKKRLLGVSAGKRIKPLRLRGETASAKGLTLPSGEYPVFAASTSIQVVDPQNSRVLMRFGDDSPAGVFHRLGEGATLTLAYNPARTSSIDQKIWRRFFDSIQQWAGCRRHLAIWRFQLPLDLPPRRMDPPAGLVCLTNNNVQMRNSVVNTPRNIEIKGAGYRYAAAPSEEGQAGKLIPLDKGRLTNRRAAFASIRDLSNSRRGHSKEGMKPADWSVSWPGSKKKPLVIEIKLDRPRPLRRVRLWVSGELPAATIQVRRDDSSDSAKFKTVGHLKPASPGNAVVRLDKQIQATARVVRLKFEAPADDANDLDLAEVELWGPDDATTQARKP